MVLYSMYQKIGFKDLNFLLILFFALIFFNLEIKAQEGVINPQELDLDLLQSNPQQDPATQTPESSTSGNNPTTQNPSNTNENGSAVQTPENNINDKPTVQTQELDKDLLKDESHSTTQPSEGGPKDPSDTNLNSSEEELFSDFNESSSEEEDQDSIGRIEDASNFEEYLNRVFRRHYSKQVSEDEWQKLLNEQVPETYSIQKGDTLWDLSHTFFGDGFYWPKVWSLNKRIFNPHSIKEGNNLNFFMGSESEPTSISVGDKKPGILQNGQESSDKGQRSVVREIPPSLPDFHSVLFGTEGKVLFNDVSSRQRKRLSSPEFILSGYVTERFQKGMGRVVEVEDGLQVASLKQYVYVRLPRKRVKLGDQFIVVSHKGANKRLNPFVKGSLGHSVEIQGQIKLVEHLSRRNMFRAIVEKSLFPVQLGAILRPGRLEKMRVDTNLSGPKGVVSGGQVIGGHKTSSQRLFGVGGVVYLNRGSRRGLAEGQILSVLAYQKLRNEQSTVRRGFRPIGALQVLKVTRRFSTAIVVKANAPIYVGDFIGSGENISQMK